MICYATRWKVKLRLFHPDPFFTRGPDAREPPYLRSRQGQAMGAVVLLAVADNPDFEAPAQPANLGPVGVSPMRTPRVALKPAVFLQTTTELPSIVATSLEAGV
jgi:hypothetical protein